MPKSDKKLKEIGISDWEDDVEFSIPTEFNLYSENCEVTEFKEKVKLFALNNGNWQEENNADKITVKFLPVSKNGNNYDYNLTLKFKPKNTLPLGKIGLMQVQIVVPRENIKIPDWITEWDMNNIDISAENFDGTKTVNLKSIAESLKSSVIADTQDKIFELDLVIDGRS